MTHVASDARSQLITLFCVSPYGSTKASLVTYWKRLIGFSGYTTTAVHKEWKILRYTQLYSNSMFLRIYETAVKRAPWICVLEYKLTIFLRKKKAAQLGEGY